jgi:hypothetical protein
MSLVIDNPDIDNWIEQSNLHTERRLDARLGLRNLKQKFPFAVEWVSYTDLQSKVLAEEWSPRPEHAVAASYDGQNLALYFN